MINKLPCKKYPIKIIFTGLSFFCLLAVVSDSYAQKDQLERAEKIYISADHVKMNINSQTSIYNGHVKISQGKRILTGNHAILIQKNNRVERINVDGNPAAYTTVTETGKPISATGQHIVYTDHDQLLVLTGNARLRQPERTVSSQRIVYDTRQHTVVAGRKIADTKSSQSVPEKERVNITLTPQKETP